MRLALDKPAEANAMDAAVDKKTSGLSAGVIVCGSHRVIEELRDQISDMKPKPRFISQGPNLCNLTFNL